MKKIFLVISLLAAGAGVQADGLDRVAAVNARPQESWQEIRQARTSQIAGYIQSRLLDRRVRQLLDDNRELLLEQVEQKVSAELDLCS